MTAQYIEDGLSLVYWFVKFSFCFQYLDLLYAPAENDRAGSGTAVTGAVFVSVLAAAETAAGRPLSLMVFCFGAAAAFLLARQRYQEAGLLLAGHILFYLLCFQLLDHLLVLFPAGRQMHIRWGLIYYPAAALLCPAFCAVFRRLYLRRGIRIGAGWLLAFDCAETVGILLAQENFPADMSPEAEVAWRFLLIFLAVLFLLFAASAVRQQNRHKMQILEMRRSMLEENYRNVLRMYRRNARLFHDFRAHLRIIRSYVEENRREECLRYLDELGGSGETAGSKVRTGNQILDLILNCKEQEAQERGIRMRVEADRLGELPVQDSDLCAICSNLLDNALEHCDREEPSVEVKLRKRNDLFLLVVRNRFRQGRAGSGDGRDASLHGIGLESVRLSVEKNQGNLEIREEGKIYEAAVMLPL